MIIIAILLLKHFNLICKFSSKLKLFNIFLFVFVSGLLLIREKSSFAKIFWICADKVKFIYQRNDGSFPFQKRRKKLLHSFGTKMYIKPINGSWILKFIYHFIVFYVNWIYGYTQTRDYAAVNNNFTTNWTTYWKSQRAQNDVKMS